MKSIRQSRQPGRAGRRTAGRAQRDKILDPYQAQQKLQEPTACRQCGAVYHHGRWQWGPLPAGAHEDLCPACRRIRDRFPAGTVTLRGDIARQRKDEIIGLARNEESAEKGEHPLNRIVDIGETDEGNLDDRHSPAPAHRGGFKARPPRRTHHAFRRGGLFRAGRLAPAHLSQGKRAIIASLAR
jgi:hypothetical protein